MEQTKEGELSNPSMLALHLKEHQNGEFQETTHSLLTTVQKGLFRREQRFLVWKVPSLPLPIKLIIVRGFDQQPTTRKLTTGEVGGQEPERVRSVGWLDGPFENGANGWLEATDTGAKPELSRSF